MSTGQVIATMERGEGAVPRSMGFDWTEVMYLQLVAGQTATFVFGGAVVLVFLVLAGQYESWSSRWP